MKSFNELSIKQQTLITKSVQTVLFSYIIGGAKKKSIDKKRHTELILRSFNGFCKAENINIEERIEMLPIIVGIATDTLKLK